MLKSKLQNSKSHVWLLVVWIVIGTGLRLTQLTTKSPWTDEFSTLVFSLGNSFRPVPLDQAIPLDVLLQPLQINPSAGARDVIHHLLSESNHPPLYFVLTHWWMKLFPATGNLVSLWAARTLPALLGAASIPAVYGLGLLAFRSRLVAQLSAGMMAVSPYGIFLAQEARHYTLAILWVIASLSCLVISVQHIQQKKPLPLWLGLSWVGINSLGISTHYFFTLTLCAEAIVLLKFWILDYTFWINLPPHRKNSPPLSPSPYKHWFRIYAVAAGTLIGGLVWLPVWQNGNSQLTEWIQNDGRVGWEWLSPVFQALAAWVTMISLLPVEASALPVVIASGAVMIVFVFWAVPILVHGLKIQLAQIGLEKATNSRIVTQLFNVFIVSSIALFFLFTYCFGIDLTRGARYNFVYFPAVILLLGASLAASWQLERKTAVSLILLMGFFSSLTVACNLGYQKYYRPDLLVPVIQESQVPVLIATTHRTHVETGELMGIGWEIKHQNLKMNSQFLLVHQEQESATSTAVIQKTLDQLSRPLDLWLVNFHAPIKLNNCSADSRHLPFVDGYKYQLYHCL